jgi:hypothetical protein
MLSDFAQHVLTLLIALMVLSGWGLLLWRWRNSTGPPLSDTAFVLRTGVFVLAAILLAMVVAMIKGLFVQSVDNDKIFAIIGPAFQTIVGCFVGMVSARVIDRLGAPAANDTAPAASEPQLTDKAA